MINIMKQLQKFKSQLLKLTTFPLALAGALSLSPLVCASTPPGIPPEAVAELNKLPGRTLTWELVVGRAFESATSKKIVDASLPAAEAAHYAARAGIDYQLSSTVAYQLDELEAASSLSYNHLDASQFSLGLSKTFTSGTTATIEYSTGNNKLEYPSSIGDLDYLENKFSVGLRQNLWKDFFGRKTRREVEAGELKRDAGRLKYSDDLLSWVLQVSELYFTGWLLQAQARAAEEDLSRRERLERITQIKSERGTAEKPELLQIQSAVLVSKTRMDEAEQKVNDVWRNLVVSIDLPRSFLRIAGKDVPLAFSSLTYDAQRLCSVARDPQKLAERSPAVQGAKLAARATQLSEEASRNNTSPDLYLNLSATANGIDENSFSNSASETFKYTNPNYFVGLTLSMALGSNAAKAGYALALSDNIRQQALARQSVDQFEIDWINECSNLNRLKEAERSFDLVYKNHLQRLKLEEERFKVGRSPLLNVIQAGDDATQTKIALSGIQTQTSMSALRILKAGGQLKAKLEKQLKGEGFGS